jgi:hypothetical protein
VRRLLVLGGVGLLLLALLILGGAAALDARAVEVQKIRAFDAETVLANELLWTEGDDVVSVYGTRLGDPVEIVPAGGLVATLLRPVLAVLALGGLDYRLVEPERILRPDRDPGLALLAVGDESPFQTRTLWYLARATALGAAGVGVLLLALGGFLARRARAV